MQSKLACVARNAGSTAAKRSAVKLSKNQRAILAAEPEAVGQRTANGGLTSFVRNVIQITIGVRCFVVDGRWQHVVAHR